jgi:hypothetical protein
MNNAIEDSSINVISVSELLSNIVEGGGSGLDVS